MMSKCIGLVTGAAALLTAVSANAQSSQASTELGGSVSSAELPNYFGQHVAAPTKAFELSIGSGYTQGAGLLQGGVGMPRVATPGIAVDLGAGYRLTPNWALTATGQYQELSAERSSGARGMTAGVAAAYHFSPYLRSDPWIQLGTGYRLLWETHDAPSATLLSHGFQLAKLTAGLDIRLAEDVAVAPVIGADLNVFLWQDAGNAVAIRDPRVSTFFFGGVQGRFDIGAAHVSDRSRTIAKQ